MDVDPQRRDPAITGPAPRLGGLDRALVLGVLFAFAVAQPLFDLLGRYPQVLAAHDLAPLDVVLLAAGLALGAPALLALVERLASRLARPLGDGVFLALSTVLAAAFVVQLLRPERWPWAGVVAALAAGGAASWVAFRSRETRWVFRVFAPAILLFPLLFLFRPSIVALLRPPPPLLGGVSQPASTPPIVLVVFDELSLATLLADEESLDAGRFPQFAHLAGRSTWFRDATTVAFGTHLAVPAILTGRYPTEKQSANLRSYPQNLFTWLGGVYDLHVQEALTRLCPPEVCAGDVPGRGLRLRRTLDDLALVLAHRVLPAPLTGGLPDVTQAWADFGRQDEPDGGDGEGKGGADRPLPKTMIPEVLARYLEGVRSTTRPVLHYLHLNLPHVPWRFLPSGKAYGPPDMPRRPHGLDGERWKDDPWPTVQAWQRHLLQSMYADRVLGEIVASLEQADLWEPALLIVTADHGVGFWPGEGRRDPETRNLGDLLRVPLFVKLPGQTQGEVQDDPVATVDVLPTIAAVLGAELGWTADGAPLFAAGPRPERWAVEVPEEGEALTRLAVPPRLPLAPTLERKRALFGDGSDDPDRAFRIGGHEPLHGQPVGEPAVAKGVTVELYDGDAYRAVDLGAPLLPAYVRGRLRFKNREPQGLELAIALNGRIEAVTRAVLGSSRRWEFSALVREGALRSGDNPVEVLEIAAGDPPELRRVRRR